MKDFRAATGEGAGCFTRVTREYIRVAYNAMQDVLLFQDR